MSTAPYLLLRAEYSNDQDDVPNWDALEYLVNLKAGDIVQWEDHSKSHKSMTGGVILRTFPMNGNVNAEEVDGVLEVQKYTGPVFGEIVHNHRLHIHPLDSPDSIYPGLDPNHPVVQFSRSLQPGHVFHVRYFDESRAQWRILTAEVKENLRNSFSLVAATSPVGATTPKDVFHLLVRIPYRNVLPWSIGAVDTYLPLHDSTPHDARMLHNAGIGLIGYGKHVHPLNPMACPENTPRHSDQQSEKRQENQEDVLGSHKQQSARGIPKHGPPFRQSAVSPIIPVDESISEASTPKFTDNASKSTVPFAGVKTPRKRKRHDDLSIDMEDTMLPNKDAKRTRKATAEASKLE